jgi:hypothetical protein
MVTVLCKKIADQHDKYYAMGDYINISSIRAAFEVTGVQPVQVAGAGNYMEVLRNIFEEKTRELQSAPGLPPGVYITNAAQEQTLASLHVEPRELGS